jgi:Fe(3+) dicitrate transport protein
MTGYVADVGWRGTAGGWLSFDNSVYYVKYGNRLGLLSSPDREDGRVLWTNVSDSRNVGVESFVEANLLRLVRGAARSRESLFVFSSLATIDARYLDGSLRDNRVELAPDLITRWGVTYRRGTFAGTIQYGRVGEQFSDASNTVSRPDGLQGLIPAYGVWDATASHDIGKALTLRAGINNLADARYFTRRATSYPGPGLVPADGRSVQVSLGWRY